MGVIILSFFYLIIMFICACIGIRLGRERTPGEVGGALLGLFLGILGILVLICLPKIKTDEDVTSSSTPPSQPQSKSVMPQKIETASQAFISQDSIKECPYCFEPVPKQARYCQYCKHNISYVPDDAPVFPAPEDLMIEAKATS